MIIDAPRMKWRVFKNGHGWYALNPAGTIGGFFTTHAGAIRWATDEADLEAAKAWRRATDDVRRRHNLEHIERDGWAEL
jgi:hypothetical protein